MAILDEEVREEFGTDTEEAMEAEAEVREAEDQQLLVRDAFGGGLDHQTLMRYDIMAHHISHAIAGEKLAQAEHKVSTQWDTLHETHRDDWTALRAIESIKGAVIAPVMLKLTKDARAALENRATELLGAGMVGEGKSRDDIRDQFCGTISKEICGSEYHSLAVEVYEALIAPVNKEPEPEPVVEEQQQAKAEEKIEEEEQREQA